MSKRKQPLKLKVGLTYTATPSYLDRLGKVFDLLLHPREGEEKAAVKPEFKRQKDKPPAGS